MKKLFYLFLAASLPMLGASCTKSGYSVPESVPTAMLVVDLKGLPMGTRADVQYQSDTEKQVSRVDIAIYDGNGNLEWTKHYEDDRSSRQVITGLAEGKKTIAVVTNKFIEIPATLDGFKACVTDLNDNTRTNFVMTGMGEGIASADPDPVEIKLARTVAKFTVDGNITTEWEGDAPQSFDITDIYLANVTVSSDFFHSGAASPTVNLRTSRELTSDAGYREMTVASKLDWSSGRQFNGGVSFYGMPNTTSTRTAVMIKAEYDGRDCWYPLVIDREIRNNTLYEIGDIKITCEGTSDPADPFTKVKVLFSLKVMDWDRQEVYPEFTF